MRTFLFFSILLLLVSCNSKKTVKTDDSLPEKITVEDSGNAQVDILVSQLISPVPAAHPNRWHGDMELRYEHSQVVQARAALEKLGTAIYPALIKHIRDDRYSYSDVMAAWWNHPVGDTVIEILAAGQIYHGGYKWRTARDGRSVTMPSFRDYLDEQDVQQWAKWATSVTKADIQKNFISWGMKKEDELGFSPNKEDGNYLSRETILNRYQRALEKLEKLEPSVPTNGKRK